MQPMDWADDGWKRMGAVLAGGAGRVIPGADAKERGRNRSVTRVAPGLRSPGRHGGRVNRTTNRFVVEGGCSS